MLGVMSVSAGVAFLDVLSPDFDFDSTEVVAAQERSWYADSPIGALVLRYAEAQELLRDPRLNHNGRRYMELNGILDGPIYDWFVPAIVNQDGEPHRRLRGLVSSAFTPRMIHQLRPFIRARAKQAAERIEAAGEVDFVDQVANPLPFAVMCQLLGVPLEDYDVFRAWSSDIGLVFSLAHGGDIPGRVEAAVLGLHEYVYSLLDRKTAAPGADLISALATAQRGQTGIGRDELCNLIVSLVFAAHDTARHQLGNAIATFAEHPGQWTLLGRQPELADRAVEEVMRYRPAVTNVYRFTAEDVDFHGLRIAENTFLTMCVPVAQRDPRVFPNGRAFDITLPRQAGVLQFGAGPHHCLGAALARAELAETLPVLAGRLAPPVITGPVTWSPPLGIHGPTALPVRFDRG
jgi:cytochrome P450